MAVAVRAAEVANRAKLRIEMHRPPPRLSPAVVAVGDVVEAVVERVEVRAVVGR